MERRLNLIKNTSGEVEKRVFPRFPFSYLTFKDKGHAQVFEVKDISFTGMQLGLKEGEHNYRLGSHVEGTLHWRGQSMSVTSQVKWVQAGNIGVSFNLDKTPREELEDFLSLDNIVASLRPVHNNPFDLELPSNLKYWLRADAPVEIFVWRHNDGELSKIHVILLNNLLEWEDGKGLRSGRVLSKRDLDSPLVREDEFMFEIDQSVDAEKLHFAQSVVSRLDSGHLPTEALDFIKLKLGVSYHAN